MDRDFAIYIVPGIIYFSGLVVLFWKFGFSISPFHFCMLFFAGEVATCLFPIMEPDPFGRTHVDIPLPITQAIVYASSITLFLLTCAIKPARSLRLPTCRVVPIIPEAILIGGCLLCVGIGSMSSLIKLGTFPVFVLSQAVDATYADVYSGLINYMGWGAGRFLATWLIVSWSLTSKSNFLFLRNNWMLVAATAIALGLNTLDGMRNIVVTMLITLMCALSLKGIIRVTHLAIGVGVIGLFFMVAGAFKQGDKQEMPLTISTGNPALDPMLYSIVSYVEPNLPNLDNLIRLEPHPSYGMVYVSEIVPDAFIAPFMTVPDPAADIMADNKAFSYPGLTFRTSYADFYVDFGAYGAVAVVTMIYGLAVFCLNRSGFSSRAFLGYVLLSPIVIFIPLINLTVGVQAIFPLLTLFVLRLIPETKGGTPTISNGELSDEMAAISVMESIEVGVRSGI